MQIIDWRHFHQYHSSCPDHLWMNWDIEDETLSGTGVLDDLHLTANDLIFKLEREINSKSVVRKCLMTDVLPIGSYPRYERGDHRQYPSLVLEKTGEVSPLTSEEIAVPLFEFSITGSLLKRDYLLRQVLSRYLHWENTHCRKLLRAAVEFSGQIYQYSFAKAFSSGMNRLFKAIEYYDLVVTSLVLSENTYRRIVEEFGEYISVKDERWSCSEGGSMYSGNFRIMDGIKDGVIYALPRNDIVGAIPIRQQFTCTYNHHLPYDFVSYIELGMTLINSYMVACLEFTDF
jgi:hypothetical protein